eukprot:scaffold17559_cov110-Isochrysis_galbana.AAC.7
MTNDTKQRIKHQGGSYTGPTYVSLSGAPRASPRAWALGGRGRASPWGSGAGAGVSAPVPGPGRDPHPHSSGTDRVAVERAELRRLTLTLRTRHDQKRPPRTCTHKLPKLPKRGHLGGKLPRVTVCNADKCQGFWACTMHLGLTRLQNY